MSDHGEVVLPRALPVFAVFTEALTLTARHSGRLLIWSAPMVGFGLLIVAAEALQLFSPEVLAFAPAVVGLSLLILACAYSVQVHRLILVPYEAVPYFPRVFSRSTWRYVSGFLVLALLAAVPGGVAGFAAAWVSDAAELGPFGPVLIVLASYFVVQVVIAKRQLLYLTDISLHQGGFWRGSWAASSAMGQGFGWRLAGLNLLSGLYTLSVSLFAGWLVGLVFPEGPQGQLEFLTIVVGLPAQLGCFACLQAACYRRLSLNPVP